MKAVPASPSAGSLPLALALALVLLITAPAHAQNQGQPGGTVRVDEGSGGVIFEPFTNQPTPIEAIVAFEPQLPAFVFKIAPLAVPGPGCQYDPRDPVLPDVLCVAAPVPGGRQVFIRMIGGSKRNRFVILKSVPPLPGPNLIRGGPKKDVIQGGQSDEKIKTGKGKDDIDPGDGEDHVNAGPGNDEADTRDGERDVINGGKGRDVVAPDGKDKLKNVEVVKGK